MSRCFIKFPIRGFRRTQFITSISLIYKNVGRLWRLSDCEELVGEVNHTTECVTDLFSFVDFEWRFL